VATRLGQLLKRDVPLIPEVAGELVWDALSSLEAASVIMIENVRYDPRETSKVDAERQELAGEWAKHVDVVVSDGFGVVHRKQASVYELPGLTESYAGLLVQRELEVVSALSHSPSAPYTVVLGGSKVSDKLGVIEALLPHANSILIGGGMVFTVLRALGHQVGKSLLEPEMIQTVQQFLTRAQELGVDIVLPSDIVMAASFAPDAAWEVLAIDQLEQGQAGDQALGLDIGPASAARFAQVIENSKTVFWNGPMGVFEFDAFSAGTKAVATALTRVDGLSVVGGGDSAAAVRVLGFEDDEFGHISTGGGASLEFLEGKDLPGLEVLGWKR
jgi:phosphoglycerate kinase